MYRGRPPAASWGSSRGRGGGGVRRGGRDSGWGNHRGALTSRDVPISNAPDSGKVGDLVCGHDLEGVACTWRNNSEIAMTLHRADRHLVYPPGGIEELERIDPLLEEERREKAKRARQGRLDQDQSQSMLITGLNISLSTPELIDQWIAERKKRWPSSAVVEKKEKESWDSRDDIKGKRRFIDPRSVVQDEPAKKAEPEIALPSSPCSSSSSSASSSASDSSDEDGESESSGSDVDEERDAVSSKVPPAALHALKDTPSSQKVCRFYQQGKCNYGDKCKDRHEMNLATQNLQQERRRKRPRAPSPNPFEAPHLLRALLKNEIAQHVNYVAQVIRFLVRNDYLQGFEEKEGEAEARVKQKGMIVEQKDNENGEFNSEEEKMVIRNAIVQGGLPILGNTLIEPALPPLKSINSLALPPEPDPLIFMDPLRSQDPKPLLIVQYRQIALDGGIRSLLLDEEGKISASLIRALSTLDDLPSFLHRSSAIELILGVSEQSQQHAHQLGPTYVRGDRNPSGSRVIGEAELFRCGLRVGPLEIVKIRQIAARISEVVGGPSFEVEEGVDEEDKMRPWWDKGTRDEMRRKKWNREADWRDQMKKLGLEVD